MANSASKFYSVMVVGDNPDALMEKYQIGKKVDKYIKYKYLDADVMRENAIKVLSEIIEGGKSFGLNKFQTDMLGEKLKAIKNMTAFEYYQNLTRGCTIDDNGDAWSDMNKEGKWNTYQKGNHFSIPLINRDGNEVMSDINSRINWKLLHMANASLYELVWEMVMEGKEPSNEEEQKIYNNMKDRTVYFSNFKNKEEYVKHNSAYWNYAYLDENGWKDMDDCEGKDIEWVSSFYEKFVVPIKPEQRVTIFEFTRNSDEEIEIEEDF